MYNFNGIMRTLTDWINELSNHQSLIIVEGKKDKSALNSLGINNIITISKPLFSIVEDVSSKTNKCMILVDLDKEGKKLYAKLKHDLQRHKVKIDDRFRNFLFKNTKITTIESLPAYLKNIRYGRCFYSTLF